MQIVETPINGLLILKPKVFSDSRGYFFESFSQRTFSELGLAADFVQDNESLSQYGVIRGLHYQIEPYAQLKLVRVVQGKILDVALDLRKDSPTFGKHFSYELTHDTKEMLLIPRGFAHGFSVLSQTAQVVYKCDALFEHSAEKGIRYDDPQLNIDWRIPKGEEIISQKDAQLPYLKIE